MNERQLQLIRVICPYINSEIRPHIMTFISFMELRGSLAAINKPLNHIFSINEPLVTDREQLLNTLKCNVNKEEAQIIDNFLMFEQMMGIMEMMKDMQSSDMTFSDSNNPTKNDTVDENRHPDSGSSPPFELLKSFLPKESAETFELVKMMMENNNES